MDDRAEHSNREEEKLERLDDPFITILKNAIYYGVKFLAFLMTLVIIWGVGDVARSLFVHLFHSGESFHSDHLYGLFASFLTVLVAIEIFLNIVIFLSQEFFHVRLVVATALTAVVRKVIILDYSVASTTLIFSIAAVVLALGVVYYLSQDFTKHILQKERT